jgi:hypothetical protein
VKIIKIIKGYILSPNEKKISKGIRDSIFWGTIGGTICMCIRWGTDLMWWEKMLLSFIITFLISFICNMVNKDTKVNMDKESNELRIKDKVSNEMSFKNRKDNLNMMEIQDKKVIKDIKNNKDIQGKTSNKDKMKNRIENFMGLNIFK